MTSNIKFFDFLVILGLPVYISEKYLPMEKLVSKGKKEIQSILADSLHQTVKALGLSKSKKKTEKVISRASKRIAQLVADQMKKELKKMKDKKEKGEKKSKTVKAKKVKKLKVKKTGVKPVLETA